MRCTLKAFYFLAWPGPLAARPSVVSIGQSSTPTPMTMRTA
jgi:hypothetical protein